MRGIIKDLLELWHLSWSRGRAVIWSFAPLPVSLIGERASVWYQQTQTQWRYQSDNEYYSTTRSFIQAMTARGIGP